MMRAAGRLAWLSTALGLALLIGCERGPEAQYRAAESLLARGKTELAREKLESLAAAYPDFASASLTLGRMHLSREEYLAAERYLAQGLSHAPEDFNHWIHLARARLELARYPEARQALRSAERAARGPLQPVMARCWIAETSRLADLSARTAALSARLGSGPEDLDRQFVDLINLRLETAQCWTRLAFPDRVEAEWNQVFLWGNNRILELEARLRADPGNLSRRVRLATALLSSAKRWAVAKRNPDQMEKYLLRADPLLSAVIALATETPRLRAEAAAGAVSLYLMRNRLEDAQLWSDRAVQWDPDNLSFRYTRAQVQQQRGQWPEALATLRAYLDQASGTAQPEAWLLYAQLLRATGRPTEALAAAETAARLLPDDFSAQLPRVDLLLALRRTDEARRLIIELSRRDLYPPEMKQLHDLQQVLVKLESARRPAPP